MENFIGWDTETHLFRPGRMAPRLVCLSLWDGRRGAVLGREQGIAWAHRALTDPKVHTAAHNSPYDWAVLMAADPTLTPLIFQALADGRAHDTRVRDALIDIALGKYRRPRIKLEHDTKTSAYSLAGCVWRHFDRDISEGKKAGSWRLRYSELDGIPVEEWPAEPRTYALDDAKEVFDLYNSQTAVAEALTAKLNDRYERKWRCSVDSVLHDAPAQYRAGMALQLMSVWGLRTDGVAVEELASSLEGDLKALDPQLVAAGIKRPDGTINQGVLREFVTTAYEGQDRRVPKTPTKKVATDKDTLKKSGDALLIDLGQLSETRKILDTYVPILRSGTVYPMHPYYNVLVNSGRTSAEKPPIQTPPRKGGVRECYVPRPGWVYVASDYDTAELRSLGQVCKDVLGESALADAYRADPHFDPHTSFASSMLGITYAEGLALKDRSARFNVVTDRRMECGHDAPPGGGPGPFPCDECFKVFKDRRQQSKPANFGYPGGMGAASFMGYAAGQGVKLTMAESVALRDAWFVQWPEMKDYFKYINGLMGAGGMAAVLQLRSRRVRGEVRYTSACNTFFQGKTADGAKRAAFFVSWECYAKPESPLYGCRPVIFMHDEIVLEAPETQAAAAAVRLAELMVEHMEVFTPDVPATASPAIMRRWYKGAEPVYRDGVLVPWEPIIKEAA